MTEVKYLSDWLPQQETIIGPSEVPLFLAAGIKEAGHYFRYFCPSGVRALPLAAGINEDGHYFRYWSERVACASRAT